MGVITGGKIIEGSMARSRKQSAIFRYSFAVNGGAVGSIALTPQGGSQPAIPSGAIIDQVTVDVITPVTSGGAATVAIQIEAANDTVNAAAVSGAPWSTAGRKAGIPTGSANALKTTASRVPTAVVATAALTAGVFDVYVDYFDPGV